LLSLFYEIFFTKKQSSSPRKEDFPVV